MMSFNTVGTNGTNPTPTPIKVKPNKPKSFLRGRMPRYCKAYRGRSTTGQNNLCKSKAKARKIKANAHRTIGKFVSTQLIEVNSRMLAASNVHSDSILGFPPTNHTTLNTGNAVNAKPIIRLPRIRPRIFLKA